MESDIEEDEEVTFWSPQPHPETSSFHKRQCSVSSDDESFDNTVFASGIPRSSRITSSSVADASPRTSPFVTSTSAPSVRWTRKTSEPTPSQKPASS